MTNNRVPWDIVGLTTASVILGAVLGAAVDGALFTSGSVANYIQKWQTLIGFIGTIGVGIVAWVNVSRQLAHQRQSTRTTLLAREEDRIEAEQPGLRDARFLLEVIRIGFTLANNDPAKIRKTLDRWGFTSAGEIESAQEIKAVLPLASIDTQQRVRRGMRRILTALELIEQAQGWNLAIDREMIDTLNYAVNVVGNIEKDLTATIDHNEELASKLRQEIERYFVG